MTHTQFEVSLASCGPQQGRLVACIIQAPLLQLKNNSTLLVLCLSTKSNILIPCLLATAELGRHTKTSSSWTGYCVLHRSFTRARPWASPMRWRRARRQPQSSPSS